jgi:hypothetical protein
MSTVDERFAEKRRQYEEMLEQEDDHARMLRDQEATLKAETRRYRLRQLTALRPRRRAYRSLATHGELAARLTQYLGASLGDFQDALQGIRGRPTAEQRLWLDQLREAALAVGATPQAVALALGSVMPVRRAQRLLEVRNSTGQEAQNGSSSRRDAGAE